MKKIDRIKLSIGATDSEMTQVWNRIPTGMRSKLNSTELAAYAQQHILPIVRRETFQRHERAAEPRHRLEVYA